MPNKPRSFCPDWMRTKPRKRDHRTYDKKRGSAHERGYDQAWEECRRWYLNQPENVFCACGCGQPSECVDHITGFKGPSDPRRLDPLNLQAMTLPCNSRKAARYERDRQIRVDLTPDERREVEAMLEAARVRYEAIEARGL